MLDSPGTSPALIARTPSPAPRDTLVLKPCRPLVRTVGTLADFDALAEAWTRLHESSPTSTTPFQAYAWMRSWWRHVGEGDPGLRLAIMVVEDRGEITGIAPMAVRTTRLAGVRTRRVIPLGVPYTDYLPPLISADPQCGRAALGALARSIAQWAGQAGAGGFDELVLSDLPETWPWLEAWQAALGEAGLRCRRDPGEVCPRVVLAETWDETWQLLPPVTRGKIGRRLRQLRSRHDAHLELAGGPDTIEQDLDDVIRLHQRRWEAAGQPGIFANPQVLGLVRDAAPTLAAQGRLVVAFLVLDGVRRAALLGLRHAQEFHFYTGGLDDAGEAMRYSPGIVAHLELMRVLHEQGIRVYDLLRGTESYKCDLGGVGSPTWTLTVSGRRPRAGRVVLRSREQAAAVYATLPTTARDTTRRLAHSIRRRWRPATD